MTSCLGRPEPRKPRRLCSSTASCTSSPTSTRRRPRSGSTRSTRSSTPVAVPVPATCSPGSWSGPASRASACRRWSRTDYINTIPPRAGAVVPGRRGPRAPDPRVHPLERDGDGRPLEPPLRRPRRSPLHVRVGGRALRRRLQPLLPRQGATAASATRSSSRATRRRASTRVRSSRVASTRSSSTGSAARSTAAGCRATRTRGACPTFWEFPTVSMGLGPLNAVAPGALQPLPAAPRDRRHQRAEGVGVRRRRRDGRARVDGRPVDRGTRAARQPDLRRQLQPAAARRSGARQRQDHPGARGDLPRRGLERHQGDLGSRAGTSCSPATSTACSSTR